MNTKPKTASNFHIHPHSVKIHKDIFKFSNIANVIGVSPFINTSQCEVILNLISKFVLIWRYKRVIRDGLTFVTSSQSYQCLTERKQNGKFEKNYTRGSKTKEKSVWWIIHESQWKEKMYQRKEKKKQNRDLICRCLSSLITKQRSKKKNHFLIRYFLFLS